MIVNAFESLVGQLMERDGYWIRSSYKVNLTKEEKQAIGRPSSPRWEIDLIGYNPTSNVLRIIECKSYLDSTGVRARDFNEAGQHNANRYKLFTDRELRRVVTAAIIRQLCETGACLPGPRIELCLVAGNTASAKDKAAILEIFQGQEWHFFDVEWIRRQLKKMAADGYENSVASVVAKLLKDAPTG